MNSRKKVSELAVCPVKMLLVVRETAEEVKYEVNAVTTREMNVV